MIKLGAVKFWMDPKGEAQESEGTSEAGMIMGGRFLEQELNGTFMGQPFEGRMSCPITNERNRWYKAVTTFIDPDHYTYESFMKDADGKEFRSMIISYTRAQ